jgi:hypothetical protein
MGTSLIRRAALAMIPMAALVAACSATVDTASVEPQILSNAKTVWSEIGLEATAAKCPSGIKAKVDTTFDCNITIEGNSETVVTATITSVDNDVFRFDISAKRAFLPIASVEQYAAETLATQNDVDVDDLTVSCKGNDNDVYEVGDQITCTVEYQGVDNGTLVLDMTTGEESLLMFNAEDSTYGDAQ